MKYSKHTDGATVYSKNTVDSTFLKQISSDVTGSYKTYCPVYLYIGGDKYLYIQTKINGATVNVCKVLVTTFGY